MFNWIKEKWNGIMDDYDIENGYDVMIKDNLTGIKFSIVDWIKALDERVQFLEDERIWLKSEVHRLNDENTQLTNELYRMENSLDARIDIIAERCRINYDV